MPCVDCPYVGQLIVDLNSDHLCMIVSFQKRQFSNFDAYHYVIFDTNDSRTFNVMCGRKDLLTGFRRWDDE